MSSELGDAVAPDLARERGKMIEECKKKPPTDEERACLMRAQKMNDILGCLQQRTRP